MLFLQITYPFFIGNVLHYFKKLKKISINSRITYIQLWLIDKTEEFKKNNSFTEKLNFTPVKEKNEAFKKAATTVALLTLKEVFSFINKDCQIQITIKKYKAV